LEEKAPVPVAATQVEESVPQPPVEREIPRALTEAEKRREELRQRYARIYSSSTTEERKQDE
jgi:hypothetical protein